MPVAVQQFTKQGRDPLETIARGLQIAQGIYGIRTAMEQNDLRKMQIEQAKAIEARETIESEAETKRREREMQLKEQEFQFEKKKYEDQPKPPATTVTPSGALLSKAQSKADQEFAKEFSRYVAKGDEAKNFNVIKKLDLLIDDAERDLDRGLDEQLMGLMPDKVRDIIDAEDKAIEDRIKSEAQKSLKQVLGAQFTEKEGRMLLDRAYNPSQPKEENIRRMRELVESLRTEALAKKAAFDFFAKQGTIQGFQGSLPSMFAREQQKQTQQMQRGGIVPQVQMPLPQQPQQPVPITAPPRQPTQDYILGIFGGRKKPATQMNDVEFLQNYLGD